MELKDLYGYQIDDLAIGVVKQEVKKKHEERYMEHIQNIMIVLIQTMMMLLFGKLIKIHGLKIVQMCWKYQKYNTYEFAF